MSESSLQSSAERKLKQHDYARELLEKSKEEMQDPEKLEIASNHMFNSLFDNVIFGVALEVYFDFESGKLVALEGEEDEPMNKLTNTPDTNIFGDKNNKKPIDCHCPNCQTKVSASRFAPHLEKCMGMGRNSSRIASRRIANARENINTLSMHISDDDDDMEWAGEKRRKKIAGGRSNNGSKKNGKGN
ncbi:ATXN7L3 family protein [Megaselia abdita]